MKHKRMLAVVSLGLAGAMMLSLVPTVTAARNCSIRGLVSTPAGAPARSVLVVLRQGGNERGRALTGDDGRYFMGRLEDGTYAVAVERGQSTLYTGAVQLSGDVQYDIRLR